MQNLKNQQHLSPPSSQQDKFYLECAAAGRVTQLAYIGSELVGAIACRLELLPDRSCARMYIMTVGVLAGESNSPSNFFVFFGSFFVLIVQHVLQKYFHGAAGLHSHSVDEVRP